MSCRSRLKKAYDNAVRIPLDGCSRYVLISDCHKGTGMAHDNFLRNQHLYVAALKFYYAKCFTYIELGDGEELWENYDRRQIESYYDHIYNMFALYERHCRLIRLYGNHNMELRGELEECVVLENKSGGRDICLLHGHQADFFNSVLWRFSRFLVRYLWTPLERYGVNDPTSAARNYKKQRKYEQCMVTWAKEMDIYLVAGHSHRPTLPVDGGLYINTGSCVHPSGITAIEIENGEMTLVKWRMSTRQDMTLFVERSVITGPILIK